LEGVSSSWRDSRFPLSPRDQDVVNQSIDLVQEEHHRPRALPGPAGEKVEQAGLRGRGGVGLWGEEWTGEVVLRGNAQSVENRRDREAKVVVQEVRRQRISRQERLDHPPDARLAQALDQGIEVGVLPQDEPLLGRFDASGVDGNRRLRPILLSLLRASSQASLACSSSAKASAGVAPKAEHASRSAISAMYRR
jgi:hypothetical protein